MVNVIDAANLERNLYFSVQLLEMGVPLVVALNMMDVARRRGIAIDTQELARRLGCPVVPIVATTGEGLSELQARMLAVADNRQAPGFPLALDEAVEQALLRITPLLDDADPVNRRWLALKMLEGDGERPLPDEMESAITGCVIGSGSAMARTSVWLLRTVAIHTPTCWHARSPGRPIPSGER